MQTDSNKPADAATNEPLAPEAEGSSWVSTFALVTVVTVLILAGLGFAVYELGSDNLPMNYPGFDGKK